MQLEKVQLQVQNLCRSRKKNPIEILYNKIIYLSNFIYKILIKSNTRINKDTLVGKALHTVLERNVF